jgi:hypothetical protein
MEHDPNERTNPMGEPTEGARESRRETTGAAANRFDTDLDETTGDRSASAFSDTSGTLGKESLGGGTGRIERRAGEVREKARERLEVTRERASHLKTTLADKLEQGAGRLRQKASSATTGEMDAETEGRVRKAGSKMADGMESTAEWLRGADVDSMKSGLENQVRSNPGRTLLVALGLGYVVGRMFRGNRQG